MSKVNLVLNNCLKCGMVLVLFAIHMPLQASEDQDASITTSKKRKREAPSQPNKQLKAKENTQPKKRESLQEDNNHRKDDDSWKTEARETIKFLNEEAYYESGDYLQDSSDGNPE